MISIAFKSEYKKINLTKVSIISEKDSFVYGLFEHFLLVESGRIPINELGNFLNEFSALKGNIHFASKSHSYTHTDSLGLEAMKTKTAYQEFFDVNPTIHCCFNDENFPANTENLKHFSTIINDHFKYHSSMVCYAHFGKNNVVVCITGLDGYKFYNQYEIETASDVLYYVKAVLQNTDTDESMVNIMVGGYIEEQSEIYKTLYRYFKHVSKAEGQNFAAKNETINPHSYFDHYLNILR